MTALVEADGIDAATIDGAQFREIMRSMASGVTVVTTSHNGNLHGITATAFSSVSTEPPTVLIVLNRTSRTHPLVSASRRFVVNLLADSQIALGKRFSGKSDHQFEGVAHTLNAHGMPVIEGATANLECETMQEVDVGTHTIFIGRVEGGGSGAFAPLVYHDGRFKGVGDQLIG